MSYWFRLQGQESATEGYASLLDLFFVLARTTLAPNNPVLTDAAYDLLFRAARLLGLQLTNDFEHSHTISPPSSVTEEAFANFVRCLSGAFHSLGGTLYQAGKYGSAIRFLRRGCPLGAVALRLRRSCDLRNLSSAQEQPKTPGSKEAEGWGQLHDQLSRRWELLGVSCSKIGDRQVCQSLRSLSNTVPEPFVSHREPTKLSLSVLARMSFHVPS
jgi:separase